MDGITIDAFSDWMRDHWPTVRKAVREVKRFIVEEQCRWAVDVDLQRFFDTVDHRIVMGRLARKLSGDPLLRLIGRYLRAGVSVDGKVAHSRP